MRLKAPTDARSALRSWMIPALAFGALALAGCGSSSSTTSSSTSTPASTQAPATTTTASAPPTPAPAASGAGSAQTLRLAAGPGAELKYSTTSLSAKAGKVTIEFNNTSPVDHNVTIASSSGAVLGETATFHGGSKSVSVTLKAGTYKYYCSVPGHRGAGMEGTLTVQ